MPETRHHVQFWNPINDKIVFEQWLTYVPMVGDEIIRDGRRYIIRQRAYNADELRWILLIYPTTGAG